MKLIEKKADNTNRTILVVETGKIFKKQTEYLATREIVDGYWSWVTLPNKVLVHDSMSFQLDAWNREELKCQKQ